MTVVITGARGYVGHALARRFAEAGCALRLVSRTAGAMSMDGGRSLNYVPANLARDEAWSDLLDGAEAVVHLSSRTDLRAAEADPAEDERINIEPIHALIRAAGRLSVAPRVVFASTVTIVGAQPANPVDETAPNRPCSVYDCHKLAGETLLREATGAGVLRAASLRLPNVYGYGQSSVNANRGILNAMMRRAASGETLTIYGDGSYVRDFTHLSDVVEALYAAASLDTICDGRHYVIATGQGHTLAEAFDWVSREAFERIGRRVDIRHIPDPADPHPIERRNFIGNSSLFQSLTPWRPRFDLRAGIHDYFTRMTASAALARQR
jgi:nucleoside-diphosphate-sugar epimerase